MSDDKSIYEVTLDSLGDALDKTVALHESMTKTQQDNDKWQQAVLASLKEENALTKNTNKLLTERHKADGASSKADKLRNRGLSESNTLQKRLNKELKTGYELVLNTGKTALKFGFAGVGMTGAGLYGFNRMAESGGDVRKTVQGLGGGLTAGELKSAEVNLQGKFLDNAAQTLGEITHIKQDITDQRAWQLSQLTGVPIGELHKQSSAKLLEMEMLQAQKEIKQLKAENAPISRTKEVLQAKGLGQFSEAEINRLEAQSPEEVRDTIAKYLKDINSFQRQDEQLRELQDAAIKFETDYLKVITPLANKLAALGEPLGNLTGALADTALAVVNNKHTVELIGDAGKKVNQFADWLAKPEHEKDINGLYDDVVKVGGSLVKLADSIEGVAEWIDRITHPIDKIAKPFIENTKWLLNNPDHQENNDKNTPERKGLATRIGESLGRSIYDKLHPEGVQGQVREYESDTEIERRIGGHRAWRNKNEGNLVYGKFAQKMGAIGYDYNPVAGNKMAIFPSEEHGRMAKEKLLFESDAYKKLTLSKAIARYAPPHENDTGNYQRKVLESVGNQDKSMSSYTLNEREQIMRKMREIEGVKQGRIEIIAKQKPEPKELRKERQLERKQPKEIVLDQRTGKTLKLPTDLPPKYELPTKPDTGKPFESAAHMPKKNQDYIDARQNKVESKTQKTESPYNKETKQIEEKPYIRARDNKLSEQEDDLRIERLEQANKLITKNKVRLPMAASPPKEEKPVKKPSFYAETNEKLERNAVQRFEQSKERQHYAPDAIKYAAKETGKKVVTGAIEGAKQDFEYAKTLPSRWADRIIQIERGIDSTKNTINQTFEFIGDKAEILGNPRKAMREYEDEKSKESWENQSRQLRHEPLPPAVDDRRYQSQPKTQQTSVISPNVTNKIAVKPAPVQITIYNRSNQALDASKNLGMG